MAPPAKVWDALTNPEKVKQLFWGAEVHTDWREGSSITYSGEWDGKPFEDKGTILKIVPEQILSATYWSPLSGLEDKPENYQVVTYQLEEQGNNTLVTITQENIATEEARSHNESNWNLFLGNLKAIAER
jgi:uncharacterized protein YndB with AHSA1/START domain